MQVLGTAVLTPWCGRARRRGGRSESGCILQEGSGSRSWLRRPLRADQPWRVRFRASGSSPHFYSPRRPASEAKAAMASKPSSSAFRFLVPELPHNADERRRRSLRLRRAWPSTGRHPGPVHPNRFRQVANGSIWCVKFRRSAAVGYIEFDECRILPALANRPRKMVHVRRRAMRYTYYRDPSPHAHIPQLISPSAFQQLAFPNMEKRPFGRTGWDLFPGEAKWKDLMELPGWRELKTAFLCQSTLRSVIDLFAHDMRRLHCLVDPDKAYLEPFLEPPEDIKKQTISDAHDPNALFFRFDVHEMPTPDWGFVHCDWPRRVVGGMLFLCSAEAEGMEGGEFGLYIDEDFRDDRVSRKPVLSKAFTFFANQGVLFLNANTGFHGPVPIRQMSGSRRWVYFSISSRRNVWPIRSLATRWCRD
jgi:hypothetical protein